MDRRAFWAVLLVVLTGCGVMLYGVSLNHGAAPNVPVGVGGAVVLVGIAALTLGIAAAEDDAGH